MNKESIKIEIYTYGESFTAIIDKGNRQVSCIDLESVAEVLVWVEENFKKLNHE